MEGKPEYISFRGHGEASAELPINISNATYYGFVMKCVPDQVQQFVDKTLNRAAPGEISYSMVGSHVLLAFLHCEHATSPTEIIGWEPDHETAVFVPLIQHRVGPLPALRMWIPYLLIDSGIGMTTGREVWGYNKTLGTASVPLTPADAAEFAGSTMIFRKLESSTPGEFTKLLQVRRTDKAVRGDLLQEWSSSEQILRAIGQTLGGWLEIGTQTAFDFLKLTLGIHVPTINLKQFRDAAENSRACYQALVESESRMTMLKGAGHLAGNYELTVTPCDSHQIEADLGLTGGNPHPVEFAFWVKMDFSNPPGRTIWRAST